MKTQEIFIFAKKLVLLCQIKTDCLKVPFCDNKQMKLPISEKNFLIMRILTLPFFDAGVRIM